ncbi:PAAR domain-containing protein [Pseudomonas fluorescens]|uniref:PAAR domain-containing protein n=1 Tax=Pseudomonas fluorescens TaxID=294 RepID=UPI0012423A6E|nr:PAAR domain-containing protein [Pseudomonas fluorescens]
MQGIIHMGDKTTGGGTVLSGSAAMIFGGIGMVRQGDPVNCPISGHGTTAIAEGHPKFRESAVPIAFHKHRCADGRASISSLPEAVAS